MSERALDCQGVVKHFRQGHTTLEVLKDVSFSVAPGERLAIVGRSGSGKSTLLHILAGLADPDAGEVRVAGEVMTGLTPAARARLRNKAMGFVYQFHHLLPEFNALENVAMPLLLGAAKRDEAVARASAMLETVGLADRLTHRPAELSGGERQRVAIARALVTEPRVVLADEPTGNLDRHSAQGVFSLILDLAVRLGTAFVVVTHDEVLAKDLDRALTLEDGALREGVG
jgi:lipoprotein-releasing system ATP-binding protein